MDTDQEGRITCCGIQGDGGEDDAVASMSGYYRDSGVGEARDCAVLDHEVQAVKKDWKVYRDQA